METENLIFSKMRSMITLVDKLRDFHLDELISLPKITVLGTQSAGKSSLLEAICGINFLPRGSGIVTRRPLELRMSNKNIPDAYFVFSNEFNEKKFINPDEVRANIEMLTDKVAGNKSISADPIILNVFGPQIPDLTVIDLPGITKISVGDQPQNIEQLTKDLVRKYCEDPGALILCVIPANIDLATSESLQFARLLDPRGERTLGVLTKIDLMDEGVDASKLLMNKEIPLFYGYVGVKGRTQKEIREKVSVEKAIQNEVDYFSKHPVYSTVSGDLLGTRALVDKVTKILYQLISTSLPRIRDEMMLKKTQIKAQLENLGNDFPETEVDKMESIFQMIQSFNDFLTQEISGKLFQLSKARKSAKGSPPKGSDTLIYQFSLLSSELLSQYQEDGFLVSSAFTDKCIQHAITSYQGDNLPGFYSFDSFISLINPKLQLLQGPVLSLLEDFKSLIENKGLAIIDYLFGRFPVLASTTKDIFQKVLNNYKVSCLKILSSLIRSHENYFFSNDVKLLDLKVKIPKKKGMSASDVIVLEMRSRLDNYFAIVVQNLRDTVPKIIGCFFMKRIVVNLKIEVLQNLNQRNYCLESFKESKSTAEQRQKAKSELQALKLAENLLTGEFGLNFAVSETRTENRDNKDQLNFAQQDEYTIEDLANMDAEHLKISYCQLMQIKGGKAKPLNRIFPVDVPTGGTPKMAHRESLGSENHSLNDSHYKKIYTIDNADHNKYILKLDSPLIENNIYKTASNFSEQISPKPSNNFDYDFTNTSKSNPNDKVQVAKDAYKTYEVVNKNFSYEEQQQILKVGSESFKYTQENVSKEQMQTGVGVAKTTAKFLSENVTKEQAISGAKTVYEGGKYVANSTVGKQVISGTKDLAVKGWEAMKKQDPPKTTEKPKSNNLFGDFF